MNFSGGRLPHGERNPTSADTTREQKMIQSGVIVSNSGEDMAADILAAVVQPAEGETVRGFGTIAAPLYQPA